MSITNSQTLFKFMSMESVMPSYHLILCRPLLLPPSIFPSIRVFSNESSFSHQEARVLELQLQHKDLLHSTEDSTQHITINYNGEESEKCY